MEFIGRFKDVSKDFFSNHLQVLFSAESINLEEINGLKDEEKLRITVKKYRKRRSPDANNYYWLLVGKVADALRVSKPYCHNLMLRRYGQTELFDGKPALTMLPDTPEAVSRMEQMEESHFAPTAQVTIGKDGVLYRAWKLLKPSHRYNTKEMSILIDGIVDDAKTLGIETMTPDQIERMKITWSP